MPRHMVDRFCFPRGTYIRGFGNLRPLHPTLIISITRQTLRRQPPSPDACQGPEGLYAIRQNDAKRKADTSKLRIDLHKGK